MKILIILALPAFTGGVNRLFRDLMGCNGWYLNRFLGMSRSIVISIWSHFKITLFIFFHFIAYLFFLFVLYRLSGIFGLISLSAWILLAWFLYLFWLIILVLMLHLLTMRPNFGMIIDFQLFEPLFFIWNGGYILNDDHILLVLIWLHPQTSIDQAFIDLASALPSWMWLFLFRLLAHVRRG